MPIRYLIIGMAVIKINRKTLKMENNNNNLRQLIISGILGDGHLKKSGSISFSCIFKEYLETLHVLSNGYVSISDKSKYTDSSYTVNLSKIIT